MMYYLDMHSLSQAEAGHAEIAAHMGLQVENWLD
jgi:hypothetical protein